MAVTIEESDSQTEGRCQGCKRFGEELPAPARPLPARRRPDLVRGEQNAGGGFAAYPVTVIVIAPASGGSETRIRLCAECRAELKTAL